MEITEIVYGSDDPIRFTDESTAQPFMADRGLSVWVINFPSDSKLIGQLMDHVCAGEPVVYGNGQAVLTFTTAALAKLAQQGRATCPRDLQNVLNAAFREVAQP